MAQSPSNVALFSYAILALPLAFVGMPLYIHAPDFYATEFGISLATIGVALLALRLFDAIQDPIIGMLSDRFAGHRKRIILLSYVAMLFGVWMVFNPSQTHSFWWFVASIALCSTALSVAVINHNAMGALLSSDSNIHTKIFTIKESIGVIGLLFASIVPALLVNRYEPLAAFSWYALSAIGLSVLVGLLFYFGCKNYNEKHSVSSPSWGVMMRSWGTFKNFFMIYAVSMVASSIPAVLVLFYVRDRLQLQEHTGLFLMLYFVAAIMAMPLWYRCATRLGKVRAWQLAMLIGCVSFVWAGFLQAGDMVPYIVICLLSGMALGGELALPPAILADLVQDVQQATSGNYAVMAFISKASLALASGVALPVLAFSGYVPATGLESGAHALDMLAALYGAVPSVVKLIALILLTRLFTYYSFKGGTNEISQQSMAFMPITAKYRM